MSDRTSRPRHRPAAAALAAGALLAAGGLAGSAASSARTARVSGLATKSPAAIIRSAQAALRATRGYVMTGRFTQASHTLGLQLTYDGPAKLELQLREGTGAAAIIALPSGAYVRANRAYWQSQGVASLERYANRWIELPARDGGTFTRGLGHFRPATLARCLAEHHGPLTRTGVTSVDGRRALVIHDAGGVPGSNPGDLDVAATGPAYPLRVTATGPTRPGGRVDACNDGRGGDLQGTLTLSRFNDPPPVTAPAHALRLGGTTTTTG